MSTTQKSRWTLLKLVLVGTLAVPAFAATRGLPMFSFGEDGPGALLAAPPPIVFLALGVILIGAVVGRRLLKGTEV